MSIRRLSDAGMNSSWVFINFIPTLGTIIYLSLMFLPKEKV
jgi:uncharacterized membrane protein YhaH (DUF805 family)